MQRFTAVAGSVMSAPTSVSAALPCRRDAHAAQLMTSPQTKVLGDEPGVEVRIADKLTVRVSRGAAKLSAAITANLTADFSRGRRRDVCDLRLSEFNQSPRLDAFALSADSARLFCALLEGLPLLRACNAAHAALHAAFRENADIAATLKLAYQVRALPLFCCLLRVFLPAAASEC